MEGEQKHAWMFEGFDSASLSTESKDALWARFFMRAPRRQSWLGRHPSQTQAEFHFSALFKSRKQEIA